MFCSLEQPTYDELLFGQKLQPRAFFCLLISSWLSQSHLLRDGFHVNLASCFNHEPLFAVLRDEMLRNVSKRLLIYWKPLYPPNCAEVPSGPPLEFAWHFYSEPTVIA